MTTPTERHCVHCHRQMSAYFKLQRFSAQDDLTLNAELCSVVCLLSWVQQLTIERGAQAVVAVKGAITHVVDMFRGGPKLPPKE